MPLLKKKSVLAVKQEATPGTPETLSASDAIYAKNVKIEPEFQFHAREDDGSLGHRTGVIGAQKAKATFEVELKGSGSAGTSPKWALVLFPACAMVEGTDANAGKWSPTSSTANYKPVTIAVYEDGRKKCIAGAMGTYTIEGEVGKPQVVKFEFEGLWVEPVDAAVPTPEADTIKPPRFTAATLTLGGTIAPVSKASIQAGNKVVCREDATSGVGYTYACVVDRDFSGKLDPEAVLVGTSNVFATFRAGTEMAFNLSVGTVAGNTITIAAPKAQYKQLADGERNQIVTDDVDLQFNKSAAAGDDELTITFS